MRRNVLLLAASLLYGQIALATETLWVDVRTPEEYAAGHLPGAINLPQREIAADIGRAAPDKSQPLKLYCGMGVRAQMAKLTLESLGYQHVENAGGYADLMQRLRSSASTESRRAP